MKTQIIVQWYSAANGKKPYEKWFFKLDDTIGVKIMARINRLHDSNFGDHKKLKDGIYEMRIDSGSGYRIYFGKSKEKIIILLGGDKSTQENDIKKAVEYWIDWKERYGKTNES